MQNDLCILPYVEHREPFEKESQIFHFFLAFSFFKKRNLLWIQGQNKENVHL